MASARILLVEDDANLGYILQENLELHGFEVTLCSDGEQAGTAFLQKRPDLCLLDVMLPKKDGFTLAREIRRLDARTPIIFLTAKSLKEDRIEGFKIGGDDYVTKPFSMEELILRIEAVLKRSRPLDSQAAEAPVFEIGNYTFDCEAQLLKHRRHEKKLTHKEAELLRLLCLHKGQVLERQTALTAIWGEDTFFNARSMDVFITRLRKYLREDDRIEIVNVHSKGFRLVIR